MDDNNFPFSEEEQQEMGIGTHLISTLEEATRYAYGLSATREEIAERNQIADGEIARWQAKIDQVNEWRNAEVAELDSKVEYLKAKLIAFHIGQFNSAPNDKAQAKVKSIKLPYGITLKSTSSRLGFEIKPDEDSKTAYEAYMQINGFTEPQPAKLKWADAKDQFKVKDDRVVDSNGEVVDFLKIKQPERTFKVD